MKLIYFLALALLASACSTDSSREGSDKEKFLNSLDKHKIRDAIRIHQTDVQQCFQNAKDKPDPNGKLALKWTVGPNGQTRDGKVSESSINSKETEDCALASLHNWKFPVAPGEKPYVVGFPFTFNAGASAPADSSALGAATAPTESAAPTETGKPDAPPAEGSTP